MKKNKYIILLIFSFIVLVSPVYAEDNIYVTSVNEKTITRENKKKAITLVSSGIGVMIIFLGIFSITKNKNKKMLLEREKDKEED